MPVRTTQSFFLRGLDVSTLARSMSSGWLFGSETVGSTWRALKVVCLQPVVSVLMARQAGVSPLEVAPTSPAVEASSLPPGLPVVETPASPAPPPLAPAPLAAVTSEPLGFVEPEAPEDPPELPLDAAPIVPDACIDPAPGAPPALPVEGALPAEPTADPVAVMLAPLPPGVPLLPELEPVLAPVPLIAVL